MSVIQSIRDKGAWIVFVIIALALIAFILQDGVKRGGTAFSVNDVITEVNGEKLERGAFEDKIKMQESMYAGQGANRDQIAAAVWNQEVESIILNQEFDKLGLTVSAKELNDVLFGENSPLRQEFTDPKTGVFRVDDAKKAFAQLKKSTNPEQINMVNNGYIIPTIQNTLRNKYQSLLVQSVYIPKWLVAKQEADNNAIASIDYVYYPYISVADSLVKVSDEDINAYVKQHAVEFKKKDETRNISYVLFNAAPSSADSNAVLSQLVALENDFRQAPDAAAYLAKVGTELPFYNSYFSATKMQMALKDSITKLPLGGMFGPYQDGNSYVLAKMVGIKNWPDSAKVRHILINTGNPQTGQMVRTDSAAKKLVDSIALAIKSGADFNALCAQYSEDAGSKDKGGVYDFFPQGQMVVPFNDFSFDKPVGSKDVVKTDFGYHYIEVLGQKDFKPAYKVAYLAKPLVASNETISEASTAAAQFTVSSKNAKQFNENALKQNKVVFPVSDLKANDNSINTLGENRQLVRWAFEKSVGDVSEPVEIGDKYVVALLTAVNKPGLMSATEARPQVEGMVRNEKKAKLIIDTKIKGNSLEEISASTKSPVLHADSLVFAAAFIAGVGSEPKVVGAAFNKSLVARCC
ncbi:MAG: peptidylprolyl isomerase [Sphingobacteriia bacterium]|nr:MAG: peptidylprolyl isomerase [Sphingobacteriia bacterium]